MTRTPKTSAAAPPAVQSSPPLPEAPRKAAAGRPPSARKSQPRASARAGLVTAADPHPAGAVPERSSTAPGGCQLPADALGADAGEARDPGRAVSQPAARPGQGEAAAGRGAAWRGMQAVTATAHCIGRCDWTAGPGPAAEVDKAAEKHVRTGHPSAVAAELAGRDRK